MLYEYALIGENLILIVILFLLNTRKQFPKLMTGLVSAVFFGKLIVILIIPLSLAEFIYPPRDLLHLFFINFIYLVLWSLWVYFHYLKREIIQEHQNKYEKKLNLYGSLLIVSNLLIGSIQILNTYFTFFSFKFFYTMSVPIPWQPVTFSVLSKITGVIFLGYTYVFFSIVLNRAMKHIRLFGLLFFLLLILFSLQWISHTAVYLGWYDNLDTIAELFSFPYGYAGITAFFLLGVVLFTHFAALILNINNRNLVEAGRHKIHLLSLIRCAYVASVFMGGLLVFPFFI